MCRGDLVGKNQKKKKDAQNKPVILKKKKNVAPDPKYLKAFKSDNAIKKEFEIVYVSEFDVYECPKCHERTISKEIQLKIYKSSGAISRKKSISAKYCTSCEKPFITSKLLRTMQSAEFPNKIRCIEIKDWLNSLKKTRSVSEKSTYEAGNVKTYFINTSQLNYEQNEKEKLKARNQELFDRKPSSQFEEKSRMNSKLLTETDLHRLGYQISGIYRSRRQDILSDIINNNLMSLENVVSIIYKLIRQREGIHKTGKRDFSYALHEWKLDLKLLKEKYYSNQFQWPNV